jgi:hypothetical protein
MINRIVEAFTKPYLEMTAIDGLIVGGIIWITFFPIYFILRKFYEK